LGRNDINIGKIVNKIKAQKKMEKKEALRNRRKGL
jgi:hypothetical protein